MDEAAVDEFGLGGKLLVELVLLLCPRDADPLAFLPLGAGRELELGIFLRVSEGRAKA